MASYADIATRPSALSGRAGGLFAGLADSIRRRRIYNQTVRELNALSTRDLNDLGIDRAMITRLALEAAYGDRRG